MALLVTSNYKKVRDLWSQKDLGIFENEFKAAVPQHGVVMLRLFPVK